ncbi:hypothetical protein Esi_0112_0083 [Ectocarpus siliculosus]|uniref:Uncharacterized protein n=1 Tax=Ectocarpus siliculosus TaxID=2880 RepID=D8LD18_ECTSI|nr:hypothetical protein Esi_0112_0083 [Ectocarpus siliculosus]|eukprot:CBN78385.1 hypothetical protein Esi_0112_0083 [Ectocarpus siliculosus]
MTVAQEVEDDDPATRRGFDALRNNGMTRGEVTAIRGYFSAQVREETRSIIIEACPFFRERRMAGQVPQPFRAF